MPFSYLDLRLAADAIDGTLVVHMFDAAHDSTSSRRSGCSSRGRRAARRRADADILPARLAVTADGRALTPQWLGAGLLADRQSLRFPVRFALGGRPGTLTVSARDVPLRSAAPDLPEHLRRRGADAGDPRRRPHRGSSTSPARGRARWRWSQKFLPAGIHHILIGPDHLLFLVGLLLLGGTIRQLAMIVTSFTIAHSITLSLAALNIVSPPARIIEPAIALSIVYVGADNLLIKEGRDVRAWIAFAFGFIHGFGFANVLREMELPARALGWSLFSFNVGVEIGQLLVVVVVATALAALRSRSEAAGRRLAFAGSVVVIAAGAFWFIQRVFFPGGMS